MKSYIIFINDSCTKAYRITSSDVSAESLCESPRDINGLTHFEHFGNEIKFEVIADPQEIEFDNATLSQLARYNMEQKNKTLVSEIAYHENRLADLKAEIEQFYKVLEQIKIIANDMIGGAEYEKVVDCSDEDEDE